VRNEALNAAELTGVEKRYGRTRALDGVHLVLPPGRLYLLQGANGAGKSTLLRVIAGLARPTRGSVQVLGVDPFRTQEAAVRARVSFLGPDPGLYSELSVRENLIFCARLQRLERSRIDTCITGLDLTAVADRPLQQLSFGYRRRAGLARALLSEPELLLLDEPWNGLDDAASQRLAAQLELVRSAKRTALVAAHSIGPFAALFDQRLRIERGHITVEPCTESLVEAEPA